MVASPVDCGHSSLEEAWYFHERRMRVKRRNARAHAHGPFLPAAIFGFSDLSRIYRSLKQETSPCEWLSIAQNIPPASHFSRGTTLPLEDSSEGKQLIEGICNVCTTPKVNIA